MSETKLTRTQSSLLRSSPTVRSSIHSLSSIDETQEEDKKPHKPRTRSRPGSNRFIRVLSLISFTLFYLTIFYLRTERIPTSQNLLLLLVLISVTLFLAGKNKSSINQSLAIIRHLCDQHGNKLSFLRRNGKPVQWFIGEDENNRVSENLREGVECYSNGNFYEGEFHKGKCNGSGVYNYFVNGRYEGDWVDGRYDGYGVESWARGSRYRGQYSQGLRHGFGVYKFYTGDTYAGGWCNGQSHGVGVQTCSDGSCYVGEFKHGVKHGLGLYHFRNGDRYSGEYFGDKIHGFGVYHFANGHCYEGSWHEGRKQGYGMYTFRNGEPQFGEWDGGAVRHPFVSLTDPVIHAVEVLGVETWSGCFLMLLIVGVCGLQTAQKMGDEAKRIRRVDQQVSRAVMAANRAATAARVAAIKAVQNRMGG